MESGGRRIKIRRPDPRVLLGRRPPPPQPGEHPWGAGYLFPRDIGERDYVVVEEVIDDNVGIVVAPWPRLDASGGLLFADEEERREGFVDRASFQSRLDERDLYAYGVDDETRPVLQARPLTVGDVFAIETNLPEEEVDPRALGAEWIRGPVIDVTAIARDAAKAAMLAAVTGAPLSPDEVIEIAESPVHAGSSPPEIEPPPPTVSA